MTKLFVDSDGCPVREESIKVACRNNIETFLVCAGGIRPYQNPLVQIIFVKEGLDSADDWIVENIEVNDIAVTPDIPLAGRCISKGAVVVKPNGDILSDTNIGPILASRNLNMSLRESGIELGGPPPYSKSDRSNFSSNLENIMKKLISGNS